jgi:hypothetical protein
MNPELLAPCGLYCGLCGIYVASRDNNQKLKEKLAEAYGVTPEQIDCNGCLSDKKFVYCQVCDIRTCVMGKAYEGCHQCDGFPCKFIEEFPVPEGKKVILRSIPARRELGDKKWVEEEEQRYTCPHCHDRFFRGAKKCGRCKRFLEID